MLPCADVVEETSRGGGQGAASVRESIGRELPGLDFGEVLGLDEGDSEVGGYGVRAWERLLA